MGGALLMAIVVAMLVHAKLQPNTGVQDVSSSNEVLVASRKILAGEKLKQEDTHWVGWPDSALYNGVYRHKDYPEGTPLPVYDVPVRRDIESGEPITSQAIIADVKGGNNFLAASIAPGMRAMGVPVTLERSVGGFLAPGDHVDLILSYAPQIPSDAQPYAPPLVSHFATQVILSNVKVLAVDQTSHPDEKGDARSSVRSITVEVTKEGAQTIALALQMGEISLALRRIGEQDVPESTVTPIITDATTSEILKRLNKITSQTKAVSNKMRIYSGTSVTNIPVRPAAPADNSERQ
jgi:pilus assembly protein CpaB